MVGINLHCVTVLKSYVVKFTTLFQVPCSKID